MPRTHEKDLVKQLGFSPKENKSGIFCKKYNNGYIIEVDFEKESINYGNEIKYDSKTTQNFSQAENFVILECVDRLLEKGYKPRDIVLEKTYPTGHGTSGRLDILVKKENNSYLMIECKTYGEEFDKELKNTQKNGGQIFTYFQQDTKTELLMLYASKLEKNKIISYFKIINIEEAFRNAGNVEKVFNLWNGKFYEKGFWENPPYGFQLEKITKADLRELTEDEGKKLFHGFATILRKHSVSDKPNAFNVIFNLFLAKLYDEQGGDEDELKFQWKSNDDPVDFQVRLYNLHKAGLFDFLKKEIEGIEDLKITDEAELKKQQKKFLKFNKLFDIKSVFNDDDFEQNHRVLKEVVKLIEKYKIRYPRKQKYLSEFFELLLTTGLKQESGQYFTPPPIAKFIVKSLPLPTMIKQEIDQLTPKLPAIIDYAAGSGHFITEIMEEYQDIIDILDISSLHYPNAKTKARTWSKDGDPYLWASSYVYGIEKDYRLVKVAKVGCYFYGDGLAQVIHGDGLDSFEKSKSYVGLLKENTPKKPQFSVVVSNPPYSVSDCKDDLEYIGSQNDFELYRSLTDKSDEIECLFVERTKQLLKEGGVAGIILPNSILSNEGIYTKTREIILQYFNIVAITQLGGNTFMATTTQTVVLFLQRKNDSQIIQLKETIEAIFDSLKDCTINGIENAVSLYLKHVWHNVSLSDYKSFIQKKPNENIKKHELYKEYRPKEYTLEDFTNGDTSAIAIEYAEKQLKKINDTFWTRINSLEKEKFFYFVLTYKQKVVLINTGEKDKEKRFLGYEFSRRRGNEGIHPIQRDKTIDECTRLFDEKIFDNPEKVSTYIYKAFNSDYDFPIHESLKNNISRVNLVDMLNFDRVNFEKNISTVVKKKVKIESKWEIKKLGSIAKVIKGVTYSKGDQTDKETNKTILTADNISLDGKFEVKKKIFLQETFNIAKEKKLVANDIFICFSSGSKEHLGKVAFINTDTEFYAGGFMGIIRTNNNIISKYIFQLLNTTLRQMVRDTGSGSNINNLSSVINEIQIPLPPLEIQQKIVTEIEMLETKEIETKKKITKGKEDIADILTSIKGEFKKIRQLCKYSGKRIDNTLLTPKNYIGVDNMLQNMAGKVDSVFVPTSGTATEYNIGDILLSNIRPYLKKIWYADNNGGSSNDVLVLQITEEDIDSKYVFYSLKQDKFFDYEMLTTKGVKMPRGDKQHILDYKIIIPPLSKQQEIVCEIEKIEVQIHDMQNELEQLSIQKGLVLKKYL
jgi:type I restriction enzyme M protein